MIIQHINKIPNLLHILDINLPKVFKARLHLQKGGTFLY